MEKWAESNYHPACIKPNPNAQIVQCSWSPEDKGHRPYAGFVYFLLEAFNYHNAIILRPDDIWQTVLT